MNNRKVIIAVYLAVCALLAAFFYGRHHAVITPYLSTGADTSIYSVVADAFLAGKRHYVEVWGLKGSFWALLFTILMLLDMSCNHMTGNVSPIQYPASIGGDFRHFQHHIDAREEGVALRQRLYIQLGDMQGEDHDAKVFLSRRNVTSSVLSYSYEPIEAPLVRDSTLHRCI